MGLVATLVLGLASGILSGMFGVGGAVVSTPGIRALGVAPLDAVGTTIPAIFPSALSGALRYHRERLLEGRVIVWVALTGTTVAVGASFLSHAVPGDGHWLMVMTAGLMMWTSFRVGRAEDREPPAEGAPRRDRAWRLAVCGFGAGLMSGLLGVGGGVVLVPAFLEWLHLPIKRALGSSLACVGLLAIPSGLTHTFLGDIDWSYAIPLAVTVIPGARIGAALAIRSSDRRLRITVAVGLAVIAVFYAVREVTLVV